jgi:hypothetical protein
MRAPKTIGVWIRAAATRKTVGRHGTRTAKLHEQSRSACFRLPILKLLVERASPGTPALVREANVPPQSSATFFLRSRIKSELLSEKSGRMAKSPRGRSPCLRSTPGLNVERLSSIVQSLADAFFLRRRAIGDNCRTLWNDCPQSNWQAGMLAAT